jgi:CheY-like chemotaxis protein
MDNQGLQGAPGGPVPEARAKTIVVVEDDAEVCALVERVLTEGGYRVVSTLDPQRTVDLVREARPDLLITDITMPAMDGYAVLRALQSDPATAQTPVVFLSGQRDFSERVRAFRVGVVDYLTKPFTRDVLLKKIERVLGPANAGRSRPPGSRPAASSTKSSASTARAC